MYFLSAVCSVLISVLAVSYGQDFSVPPVILEAFQPSGFRASIPALPGIAMFAFHGARQPLSPGAPGEFFEDILKPSGGFFRYYNPDVKLSKGEVVHYWVFVQHNNLGYRRDSQSWEVTELKPQSALNCASSKTKVENSTTICIDSVIFEDNFDLDKIDQTKWTLETYIPTEPDYEFVIYKGTQDVTFIKNNKFYIKPKLINDEEDLIKDIDLGTSCTKDRNSLNCRNKLYRIQNPIVSGRITSKIAFTYGKFEVKARLPAGDWIIPQIYLEDENQRRILIAYSRGNAHLVGNDGIDIGGSLLFGGPVSNHNEPQRSSKLSSYRHSGPLSGDVHTYTLVWSPEQMELFLDGAKYGTVATERGFTNEDTPKFRLVFGVGVGGINDFPDGFKSGDNVKPWINRNALQVKSFYREKDKWYPTWGQSSSQLEIEYVKVTAI